MNEIVLTVFSGVTIGIVGGFHCVGMCGPIALSLPIHQLSQTKKTLSILFYNLGRALSYATMGLAFGIIGQSFSLFKFQRGLSILAGVFILTILLLTQVNINPRFRFSKFSSYIKNKLSRILKAEKKTMTYLLIGLLNGLLPCGLVYMALAAAIATGSVYQSGLLMFAFGLGTIPIMVATMIFGKYMSMQVRNKFFKITPYLIAGVATLLIIRGLNLGIPYLSPMHDALHHTCCHKQ